MPPPAAVVPGRHHSGMVGDIISESRAASSRNPRAASSESASHFENRNSGGEIKSEIETEGALPDVNSTRQQEFTSSRARLAARGVATRDRADGDIIDRDVRMRQGSPARQRPS